MIKNRLIILVFVVLFLFGCGAKRIERGDSAETLYQRVIDELGKKSRFPYFFTGTDYDTVFKLLKEVQIRYTYSPYATLAELRTADAHFKQKEYEQASAEYEEFMNRHPGHEEVPYATFRLGLSHYKQRRSLDRDPTHTREAVKWFSFFIEKYPGSPLINKTKEMRAECRKRLAKREIYIGKLYAKRKNHKAAAQRFKVVVKEYDDTGRSEEALFLLGQSYFKMDERGLAKDALEQLIEEFPKAEYHKKATNLLAEIKKKERREAKKG